jgi:hypothetical protein
MASYIEKLFQMINCFIKVRFFKDLGSHFSVEIRHEIYFILFPNFF